MVRKIGNGAAGPSEAGQSNSALVKISAAAPTSQSRLHPVLLSKTSKSTSRLAECAGRTTAECLTICCCFPCGLLNLLFLAAVRLPAGLCCRLIRKHIILQRSKKKPAILGPRSGGDGSVKARLSVGDAGMTVVKFVEDSRPTRSPATEVVEMEEAVWSKFHSSGFWRTPSQGEDR